MMDDGERDTLPMLPDHGGPSRRSQTRRSTRRSASMFSPVINFDEGESPSAYEADGDTTFHTGPLRTDPAAPQFVTMSPSLYGGRHSGRSEPSAQLLEEPSERPAIAPKREVGLVRWADERGDYGRRRNDHLDSGSMGMCNDPYCTTCPSKYRAGAASQSKFHRVLPGDAGSWTRKCLRFRNSIFTIMNPHERAVRRWNKFFVISCMVAIFIDPLFFFIFSVKEDSQCMSFDWSFGKTLAVVRSITDFIYFLHMLLQFNLAYVAPETRVVGTGELITDRRKISLHYLSGYFALDLFIVLPLPQVMILFVVPEVGISVANYAKNLLRVTVLLQYIPRLLRVFPLLAGQSESGFIFESAWANFVINLFMFVLSGHVVGSCWYLFGIQRVNKCLKDACILISNFNASYCSRAIDCGHESDDQSPGFSLWQNSSNGSVCLSNGDFNNNGTFFDFGIYRQAPLITKRNSFVTRYVYSLFWGFQQISTLAGNQVPSDFVWEVLFTMGIIGLGLLLFALLIGNMQNFLLALGRRRLEMQLRRRDVEQWMSHRRLPESLRRQVREAERFNWAATRGVDEQGLLVNLPENLQREIRRHLFSFLKTVHIFTLMDEHVLDAICERLRQRLYMCESYIQEKGRPVEKMVFIVRGEIESKETDEKSLLTWGDVCGEELLTWYLEHSSLSKDAGKVKFLGQRLLSERTIKCKQNVEAFILQAADLEYVTIHFARLLQNPRVQRAIR